MSQAVYRFGPFTVDTGAHVLLKGDTRLSIQEQPFQVLLALLESAGQVVTREALRTRLWGTDTFVDFDQSLNSALRRLRLALEDNSREPVFVETIPRVGFRFLPAVVAERGLPSGGVTALALGAAEEPAAPLPVIVSEVSAQRASKRFPAVLAGAGIVTFAVGLLIGVRGTDARRDGVRPVNAASVDVQVAQTPQSGGAAHLAVVSETGPNPSLRGGTAEMSELQGWYHLRQRTQSDYVEAQQAFEQALARRPDDAQALVGLGQAEILMALNGDASAERLQHARQVGQKALALAPHLASAHTVIGAADALTDWNDAEAEQEFRTALHLEPEDSLTHLWLAVFVLLPRRDYSEAEQEARMAVREDPLSLIAHTNLGWILYCEGKRQLALEQYRFVLQLNPGFQPAEFRARQLLSAEGRLDDGELLPRTGSALGRVEDAAATRTERTPEQASGVCAQASALPHIPGQGRLPALRAAVEQHCPTAFFFGQDPELAKLQKDPAFAALLQAAHPAHGLH